MTRSSARQDDAGIDFRREAEAAARAAGLTVDDWTRSVLGDRSPGRDPSTPDPVRSRAPDAGQPVERILSSLDRLGERIRSLSARPAADVLPAAALPPQRRTADPLAGRPVAGSAARPARQPRGGIELQRAIEQIARKRDLLDRAGTDVDGTPTVDEAEPDAAASVAPAATGAPAASAIPSTPDPFEAIRSELGLLRDQVAAGSLAPRLTALERSYDEVVNRLDQLRGAIDNPRTVADLVQRLSEIRRLLAQAPTETQLVSIGDRIDRIEQRLSDVRDEGDVAVLAAQVTELASAIAGIDPSGALQAIDARLDRVTRQVTAFEKRFASLDGLARLGEDVGKQAATLSVLAQRSEPIPRLAHEMERHSAAIGDLARNAEALPRLMTDVAELRGTVDAEATRTRQQVDDVLARIEELADAIAGQPTAERLAEFVDGRLDDIARRFDAIGAPLGADTLAAVDARIAALTESLEARLADIADGLARRPADGIPAELVDALLRIEAHLATDTSQSRLVAIEDRIATLAVAVDGIGTTASPDLGVIGDEIASMRREIAGLATPPSLDGLEREIRTLADAMERMSANAFDPAALDRFGSGVADLFDRLDARIADVAERVDRLPSEAATLEAALARFEATLAEALAADGPVTTAAAAAARAAVGRSRPGQGGDEMKGLRAELATLTGDLRAGAERDRALLIAIGEAVERLASRGEELPGDPAAFAADDPAAGDAAAGTEPALLLDEVLAEAPPSAPRRGEPAGTPAMSAGDNAAWEEIGRSLAQSVGLRPARRTGASGEAPVVAPGPELDTGFEVAEPPRASPAAREDVLLEPGSGRPAALAGQRTESERREPSKADFIAAARRAAQSVQSGETGAEPRRGRSPENPGAKTTRSGRPKKAAAHGMGGRLAVLLGAGRRRWLGAAAVAALVVGVSAAVLPLLDNPTAIDRAMVETFPEGPATAGVDPAGGSADEPVEFALADPGPDEDRAEVAPAARTPAADASTAIPPAAIVDETATAAVPLGPARAIDAPTEAPPSDRFAPRESADGRAPSVTPLAPSAAPAADEAPAARPAVGMPVEEIGPPSLREAAAAGDPAAQFEVAVRLTEGRVVPQDLAAAAAWYGRAAEGGQPLAQYRLGSLHEKGQGVPRDLGLAKSWYTRAAEAGNAKAMHNLAVLNAEGQGGAPDYDTAARWFTAAADFGVRDSQYNLGILAAKGLGMPRDLAASYKWFAIAAAGGDADAARKRDDVAQVLDQETLAMARLAVETWSAKVPDPVANEPPAGDPSWYVAPETVATQPTGPDMVSDAQTLLAGLGYDPGPADGRIGERTRQAIESFQRERGLPVTGEVDADLLRALAERPI